MGAVLGWVSKAFVAKKVVESIAPKLPEQQTTTPAQPAAAVVAPDAKTETGVDTTGETLKRKARGKKSLMINTGANTGGGSTGGTGLNI